MDDEDHVVALQMSSNDTPPRKADEEDTALVEWACGWTGKGCVTQCDDKCYPLH